MKDAHQEQHDTSAEQQQVQRGGGGGNATDAADHSASAKVKAKVASDFNSWVIGGGYAKTTMKRNQIKADMQMKQRYAEQPDEEDDKFRKRLNRRVEQLKEEQGKPMLAYTPKVTPAMLCSLEKGVKAQQDAQEAQENGQQPKPSSRGSPRRATSPSQRKKQEEEQQQLEALGPSASETLRKRLQMSFAQTTAAHAYGTLFPPLLTPYSRPMNFVRGVERVRTGAAANDLFADAKSQQPSHTKDRDSFSVVANNKQRPQPISGPQAFLPTGSATTAYRVFASHAHAKARVEGKETTAAAQPMMSVLSTTSPKKSES